MMVRFFSLAGLFTVLIWPVDGGAQTQDTTPPRTREVLSCEEAARLTIDRERLITRSISGAQEPDPLVGGGGAGNSFPSEISKFEEDNRRRRLIDDCLTRTGQPAPAQ
jgi:hypothetical protein